MTNDPSTWSLTDAQSFLNGVAKSSGLDLPFPAEPVMGYGTILPGTVQSTQPAASSGTKPIVLIIAAVLVWEMLK